MNLERAGWWTTRLAVAFAICGLLWVVRPLIVSWFRAARSETRYHDIVGTVVDERTGWTVRDARVVLLSAYGFGIHANPFLPSMYRDTAWTDDRGAFRMHTRLAGSV